MNRPAGILANTQLVLQEREARDRHWWEQALDCFHPDSAVHISWFHGTGPGFVAASRQLTHNGDTTTHRPGPPTVRLGTHRALIALPMSVHTRTVVQAIEVDLAASVRLLYRTERRNRQWRIAQLDAVYEYDTLSAAIPGHALTIPTADLDLLRPSYRMLSWSFRQRGIPVSQDELGDDRPEHVAAAYRDALAWLA